MGIIGCATDPNVADAATWFDEEEKKQKIEEPESGNGPLCAAPFYSLTPGEANDPFVETPHGRYRLSVLKRVLSKRKSVSR